MLDSLSIQDVVLVERLDLRFTRGLSVFTGETGAGKSILLDALGLALGGRADVSLVRSGKPQAVVSAVFSPPVINDVWALLNDQGIEAEEGQVILRRMLGNDGRSRAFINDQAVSIGLLKQVGEALVDIHGQFDRSLEGAAQQKVLDEFGKLEELLILTKSHYQAWQQARDIYLEAESAAASRQEKLEILHHRLKELEALDPKPGEEEELSQERNRLANKHKILEALEEARFNLKGDKGADHLLYLSHKSLGKLGELLPASALVLAALDRASVEVQEVLSQLEEAFYQIDHDPRALDSIEERLYALRALARKYGCLVEELPETLTKTKAEVEILEAPESHLSKLLNTVKERQSLYLKQAQVLHDGRQQVAIALEKVIHNELPELKLANVQVKISVNYRLDAQNAINNPTSMPEATAQGIDQVEFLVKTHNLGDFGLLTKVASGGEQSRLMLAFKVALADLHSLPTLIFDEADSGIGGAVATAMGQRLAKLGQNIQVLAITHSPQVAACAQEHFIVRKNLSDSTTTVVALSEVERREEIARMLSGATITDEARQAAQQLLQA